MPHAHNGVTGERALSAPHQVTIQRLKPSRETYTCGALTASHSTDALRRLLRLMVGAGMSGSAEVRGEDGKLRMTVRNIVAASGLTLTEDDKRGFQLRPHRPWNGPNAEDVSTASGLSERTATLPARHQETPLVERLGAARTGLADAPLATPRKLHWQSDRPNAAPSGNASGAEDVTTTSGLSRRAGSEPAAHA